MKMNKASMFAVVIAVLFFVAPGLCAQAQTTPAIEPQTQNPPLATSQSVEELRDTIKKLQEQLTKESNLRVEQSIEDQKVAEDAKTALLEKVTATEKALQAKLDEQNAKQRAEDEATQKALTLKLYSLMALVVGMGIAGFLIQRAFRGKKVQVIMANAPESEVPGILRNPTVADLREFAKKYNLEEFPTMLTLTGERECVCHAKVPKNGDPVKARIEDDPVWVNWANRKERAEKVLSTLNK